MGVGRFLKEQKPAVQVVAVEPPAGELVQGLRNLDDGFVPPIFDPTVLDRKIDRAPPRVDRVDAAPARRVRRVRRASRRARPWRARRRSAAQMESGTIVTLLPDGGWKYLSSGAWTDDLDVVEERATPHQLLVTRCVTVAEIGRAVEVLRRGGLVAFPTETVYGLGADAAHRRRARAVFRGEGPPARPSR